MNYIIGVFALLLGLTGCAFLLPYTKMDGGRLFPKPPNYSVIPSPLQMDDKAILDFHALYSRCRIWKYEGVTHTNYVNLRFWPTGECAQYVSLPNENMSKEFCESFKTNSAGWSMGFYNLKNGAIAFEIYAGGAYNRSFGRLVEGGIHVSRMELQYARANFKYENEVDMFYRRLHLGHMEEQPDWSPTGVLHRVSNENTHH